MGLVAAPLLAIGAAVQHAGSTVERTPAGTTAEAPPVAPSRAEAPRGAPSAPASMRFIPPGIDWPSVIGPPPAPDSKEAFADLAIVKFEQARRSPSEIDDAWRGVALEPVTFDQALSGRFDSEIAPKLYALVAQATTEVRAVNSVLKRHYTRPRPFMADPTVTPIVPKEEGNSYPSSHATRGLAVALLLADIFPERREALVRFGRQAGYSRVVGGVHYPSDVEAGFRVAEGAVAEIVRSDAWRRAVAEAADDIARVRADMVASP